MRLLDRYVFGEWLKILGITLGALIGMLVVGSVYDAAPDFIAWKTPAATALWYFALSIPPMMPLVLPLAVLVSLLFILGHLHKNQEITAMRAAGLSIWRITRPLWAGGLLAAAALLALNTLIAPAATAESRTIRERAEFDWRRKTEGTAAVSDRFSTVLFDNGTAHRRWRIGSLGAYTGQASGIQVFDRRADGTLARQVVADFARYDEARGHWSFEKGRVIAYDATGRDIVAQPAFTTRDDPAYTEKPLPMLLAAKKQADLSLTELGLLMDLAGDADPARTASLAVRYHAMLASAFGCLVVVGIAIPFALSGVRVNPMVGVSKAIGLYAAYYAMDRIGYALGSQQILPPLLAAWLPNLVALGIAIHLCRKVN